MLVLILVFLLLTALVLYLSWRLWKCKCRFYETFESEGVEADKDAGADKDTGADKDADTGADKDTEADKDVEADKDTGAKETDVEVVEKEPKMKVVEKGEAPEPDMETAPKAGDKKKKETMADKFMNYGEMKLFDSLRENAYSLQDIKRMIREGEITEKMIEKFLARVESMENRSTSKKSTTETTIEGFAGNGYASAVFH